METLELRDVTDEGRTIIGLALPFDDVALAGPGRPEIAARGALPSPTETELRDGHDGPRIGTAHVYETDRGYEMRAELDTPDADRYRGGRLSVGMVVLEHRIRNGVRILKQIALDHVAVVPRNRNPAYATAAITETRETPPMEETTTEEATAVATPETPDQTAELVELREQLADMNRTLAAAPWRTNEEPLEHRRIPEIRSAGDYVYHRTVVLNPAEVTPAQHALSVEKLGMTELELRQQTSASGDSPIPSPYLGPLVDAVFSGRPFANAMGSRPLPGEGGMTITRPAVTQSTQGAWESAEGDAAGSQQWTTADITGAIKAYKTANQLTMQAVLRSNPSAVDGLLRDQAAEIAQAMEASVINGAGTLGVTTGELAGILNNGSIQAATDITTFDAAGFMASWSNAYALCVAATNAPPRFVGMHPRRWAALLGVLDADNRPLLSISTTGTPVNVPGGGSFMEGTSLGGPRGVGTIQGVPVVITSGIPTNISTNQDVMILVSGGSAEPFELYEDPVRRQQWTNPSTFQTTYSGAFMAALLPIRPEGVVTIGGAGMT